MQGKLCKLSEKAVCPLWKPQQGHACGCPLSGLDLAFLVAHLALLKEESEEEETSEDEVEMQEVCMRPDCISCLACFDDRFEYETF